MILPAALQSLVPHAHYVVLRPYTPIAVMLIPNLGLRLSFRDRQQTLEAVTVTNPIFKAIILPHRRGLIVTASAGLHQRFCGDIFLTGSGFAVTILACTAESAKRYTSDIIFVSPVRHRPAVAHKAPPVSVWSPLVAQWAYRHAKTKAIKKKEKIAGRGTAQLWVSRFVIVPPRMILGFKIRSSQGLPITVTAADLFQGEHDADPLMSHYVCGDDRHKGVYCALLVVAHDRHVTRWRLMVTTNLGIGEVSW